MQPSDLTWRTRTLREDLSSLKISASCFLLENLEKNPIPHKPVGSSVSDQPCNQLILNEHMPRARTWPRNWDKAVNKIVKGLALLEITYVSASPNMQTNISAISAGFFFIGIQETREFEGSTNNSKHLHLRFNLKLTPCFRTHCLIQPFHRPEQIFYTLAKL